MSKFFISAEQLQGDKAYISGPDADHILRVLRMKPGDELMLCDGQGADYQALIANTDEHLVEVKLLKKQEGSGEPRVSITLFQGLPKSDKMEYIIMKCTELGVCRVVPMLTRYTVPKISGSADKKLVRWNRVATEASKQCMRSRIPVVEEPISFAKAVSRGGQHDLAIIPYELESSNRLASVLNGVSEIQNIAVYIGPEGGFSKEEIELAEMEGIHPVTLGPRILRTETAGCAVAAMLLYALDEI